VYNPAKPEEYAQNDRLRKAGRIDHYGPADYAGTSSTAQWLRLQIQGMCERIVRDREAAVSQRTAKPPRHLNPSPGEEAAQRAPKAPQQAKFLD
jgi:hypothetical protein